MHNEQKYTYQDSLELPLANIKAGETYSTLDLPSTDNSQIVCHHS